MGLTSEACQRCVHTCSSLATQVPSCSFPAIPCPRYPDQAISLGCSQEARFVGAELGSGVSPKSHTGSISRTFHGRRVEEGCCPLAGLVRPFSLPHSSRSCRYGVQMLSPPKSSWNRHWVTPFCLPQGHCPVLPGRPSNPTLWKGNRIQAPSMQGYCCHAGDPSPGDLVPSERGVQFK